MIHTASLMLRSHGALTTTSSVQVGSEYTFTIRDPATVKGIAFGVSYDAFIDDVQVCLSSLKLPWIGRS